MVPAGATSRGRRSSCLEKPIAFASGAIVTINLVMNHGGWNSDDNQNCNLGRFRLAITSEPDPAADPIPRDVRAILAIPRDERTRAQTDAVFAYWRTTVPEWKAANAQIEALWRQHPEGTSQLVLEERERTARDARTPRAAISSSRSGPWSRECPHF